MFDSKKKQLFEITKKESTSVNAFIHAATERQVVTTSGNGAKKYTTSGDDFVDQFSKLGTYKTARSFNEIASDCEILWASNPRYAVLFAFYIRTIPRKVQLMTGATTETSQKGGELKHEGIMRMMWLHFKSPKIFWDNIGLFTAVGSWKDIITMLRYDLVHHGWEGRKLDWNKFGNFLLSGLNNTNTLDLIKKYLPQIRAKNACTTVDSQANVMIAKWICSLLYGGKESSSNYKRYRLLKTSGTAHDWQKLISQGKHDLIDFNAVHGRALNLLVKSKYLFNQGLSEKYAAWVSKPETEVKYVGFVHELFQPYDISGHSMKIAKPLASIPQHIQDTLNGQFNTLVKKAKDGENHTNLMVVRDTSCSMSSKAKGVNMSSYSVAKAIALYFSEFLSGPFANHFIEFNNDAKMHQWKGNTPMEKWFNDTTSYIGTTDFQRVIKLFCHLKLQNSIKESDFPSGILCISDGEFNPAQLGKTNVESARIALRNAGFSKEYADNFVIALWNIPNEYYQDSKVKFETFGEVQNVFYMSGYSASIVSFLNGKVSTPRELFEVAMDQEILRMVKF